VPAVVVSPLVPAIKNISAGLVYSAYLSRPPMNNEDDIIILIQLVIFYSNALNSKMK